MDAELDEFLSVSCSYTYKLFKIAALPVIQTFAIILNIFSAHTFAKWKNPFYKCLSASAFVEVIWLVLYFAFTQTICENNPNYILTFGFQFFQLLLTYLIRAVSMTSILINIQIASDRFFILTKEYIANTIKKHFKLKIFTFFLISLLFYTPSALVLKIHKIEKCENCTLFINDSSKCFYYTYFSEFFQKNAKLKYFIASMNCLINLIFLLIMIVLNALLYRCFKKFTQFKIDRCLEFEFEESEESSVYENYQITFMVIWISCMFIPSQ